MRKYIAHNPGRTPVNKLATFITFVIIFTCLYFARDVFIPIALALLLTFVLWPVADWLERWRFPRSAAAVSVVIVLCLVTLGLGWVVGDQIVRFAQDLPRYQDEIRAKTTAIQKIGRGVVNKFRPLDDLQNAAGEAGTEGAATRPGENPLLGRTPLARETPATTPAARGASAAVPIYIRDADQTSSPLGNLAVYAGYVLSPLGTAGIVLVLLLFLLLERDQLRDRFIRLISGGHYTVTTQALNDAASRIGRYLRAQLIVNGTYGITISLGLWAIGAVFGNGTTFPSFVLWGVLCAVLRFIPYVGPWVAAAFPLAVSLAVYEGFGVFIATGVMIVVIEILSNNLMEPLLYGSSTGLSTVALLIAAVGWTWLWGPVGLFLSTPLTVCLVVMGKYVPHLKFLDVLLGDEPALPAGARFYQRILADHQADAIAVARQSVDRTDDPAAMADQVILNALRLARMDRRADRMTAEEEQKFYDHVREIVDEVFPADPADPSEKEADPPAETTAADGPLIVGVPAHHRSELLAIQMLGRLVEPIGGRIETLPHGHLPTDVADRVAAAAPRAVFIAVLPPGGTMQALRLCRRLRRQFPHLPIVLGYFGPFRDLDRLSVRFRGAGASHVATSFEQSRAQLASALGLSLPQPSERAAPAAGPSLCGAAVAPVPGPL